MIRKKGSKWRSKEVTVAVEKELMRRMERVVVYVESQAVRLISKDQPVRRTASGKLVATTPATPGAPPRVLYARLRQSVDHDVVKRHKKIIGRVGTNVPYGKTHEEGSHPWLRPALRKSRSKIKDIIGV